MVFGRSPFWNPLGQRKEEEITKRFAPTPVQIPVPVSSEVKNCAFQIAVGLAMGFTVGALSGMIIGPIFGFVFLLLPTAAMAHNFIILCRGYFMHLTDQSRVLCGQISDFQAGCGVPTLFAALQR
jgi:hypothetical protein